MRELPVSLIPSLNHMIRTKDNTKQTHILSPFVKSSYLGLKFQSHVSMDVGCDLR